MAGEVGGPTPQGPREHLINRFIELSNEVSSRMRPQTSDVWSEVELTMHQFRALSILSRGPLRIGDLASRLGIRLSSATNLAQRLETKGLLERIADPEDRRVIWCRLSPLGMDETQKLWNINRQLLESLTASLTDEELQAVIETFEVLSTALRRNNLSGPQPPHRQV